MVGQGDVNEREYGFVEKDQHLIRGRSQEVRSKNCLAE